MFKHLYAVFGVVIALSVVSNTNATFLPAFTGNSQTVFETPDFEHAISDGLINFSVYENTGNWITDLGVSSTALPGDLGGATGLERYVYFYQVVNTNPVGTDDGDKFLLRLQIEAKAPFSGGGFVTITSSGVKAVFDETVGGATGPPANQAVGPDPVTDLAPNNHIPGFSGGSVKGFVGLAGAFAPTSLSIVSGVVAGTDVTFYQFTFPSILTDDFTSVVYLTSNSRPSYQLGRVLGRKVTDGDIPSNTPEPGSRVTVMGAIACGLVALRACKKI